MVLQMVENLLEELLARGECMAFQYEDSHSIPEDTQKDFHIRILMDDEVYEISRKSETSGLDPVSMSWECHIKRNYEVIFHYRIQREVLASQGLPKNQLIVRKIEAFLETFTQPLQAEQAAD